VPNRRRALRVGSEISGNVRSTGARGVWHRPAVLVSVSCDFDRAVRIERWLQLADPTVESWKASFPRS